MLNEVNNVIMIIHTKETNYDNKSSCNGSGSHITCRTDSNESWNSIKKGELGISKITSFDSSNLAVHIAAEVKGFLPEDKLGKKILGDLIDSLSLPVLLLWKLLICQVLTQNPWI